MPTGLKKAREKVAPLAVESVSRKPQQSRSKASLERMLADVQRARMRAAYRAAGPAAVAGFRQVLEAMMDPERRAQYQGFREGGA